MFFIYHIIYYIYISYFIFHISYFIHFPCSGRWSFEAAKLLKAGSKYMLLAILLLLSRGSPSLRMWGKREVENFREPRECRCLQPSAFASLLRAYLEMC